MNENEYQEMFELESHYWWFVARRQLVGDMIRDIARRLRQGPTILDVGCGTGINQTEFSGSGRSVGIDSSLTALTLSRQRGVNNLIQSDIESLGIATGCVDLITALDVLEHVDDDLLAMKELRRVLSPDGALLVTVPAYRFLWSEHDEALHHRRRYTASELRNKLTLAGFQVERVTYFLSSLFLPILFIRFVQSVFIKSAYPKTSHIILPGWINSLLIFILRIERLVLRTVNLPFGVSVVCVARK
jgi:ubiquinone/menaquinone biosynthesis C-methylase UbiE